MKTNKEIKPFKMRCGNATEVNIVQNTIKSNGCRFFRSEGDGLCVVLYKDKSFGLLESSSCYKYGGDAPTLTYSEFIKLYGEEEEVFTSNDMKEFAEYALEWLGDTDPMFHNVSELLTKYLSERTND